MHVRIAVTAVVLTHFAALIYGAAVHSPTYNEPAHLAAGISYWQLGRFDVYAVNPPLVRLVAAVPVLVVGCQTDWSNLRDEPGARCEMAVGSDLCTANGERILWLMTLARWACLPFSLVGAYVCYRWAYELYGTSAAIMALLLWCFTPDILAHAQLATCDAAAAALGILACYQFWRWLKTPTWWNALFGGVTLGVAELAKSTLLLLYPAWPLLWLAYRGMGLRQQQHPAWGRELAMLAARMATSLYLINLGYGFDGTFKPLGEYQFVSATLAGGPSGTVGNRFQSTCLSSLPVPLPESYLVGLDLQRRDFESYKSAFYLGGTWSHTGWWYYYLYALSVKVPLGVFLLLLMVGAVRVADPRSIRWKDELILLTPAILLLVSVSFQTGINEHLRYVLPVFPFVFIWASSAARGISGVPAARRFTAAAVAWIVLSSASCFPHSLSYFNELAGGPALGWRHLANSNLDWGQDLIFLKRWAQKPRSGPLSLSLYGTIDPRLIGIDGMIVSPWEHEGDLPPGTYIVSATILAGYGQTPGENHFQRLYRRHPDVERIGGALFVLEQP